jgi:hypothetical protein
MVYNYQCGANRFFGCYEDLFLWVEHTYAEVYEITNLNRIERSRVVVAGTGASWGLERWGVICHL